MAAKKKQTTIPGAPKPKQTTRQKAAQASGVNSAASNNAPALTPTGTAQTYIGVPNDYFYNGSQTQTQDISPWNFSASTTYNVADPIYKQGDQYRTFPTDPQEIQALQQAMIQAGYLSQADAKKIVIGNPDPVTIAAFRKLLATANTKGSSWDQTLSDSLAAMGAQPPEKGPSVPPNTITLTNPADIRKAANDVAKTLYGGNLPDNELDAFVANFQQAQTQAQNQAYYQQYNPGAAAGESGYGPGGTTVSAPDPTAAAEDYIKKVHPDQVARVEFNGTLSNALSSLSKTGGGLM